MQIMLANVIFPAPSAAYFVSIFFPVAALLAVASECMVFACFQRGIMSRLNILGVVVVVNLFSWLVGLLLSFLLPSGLIPQLVGEWQNQAHIIVQGPRWDTIAIFSFFWACLVSIGLEYGVLWIVRRRYPFRKLALCVSVANMVSYSVIGVLVVASVYLDF